MSLPTPYYEEAGITIYHGNCVELLSELAPRSIGALVTDPPYSSGGQFRGDRAQKTSLKYVQTDSIETCRMEFAGDNRDQRAYLAWASIWLDYALRCSTPGAVACLFTDWRQLPVATDALQCGGWVWRNIVTWWKPGCRMQRGRFSSSAEYILYGSNGVPVEGEKSPQNVLSFPGVGGEDKEHIAEKPLPLVKTLLGVTPTDAVICDPFMGSGTTLRAAKDSGRKAIGMDIDERCCESAANKLRQEVLAFTSNEVESDISLP